MEGLTGKYRLEMVIPMSQKGSPGRDEGGRHSGRGNSWCQPGVLEPGGKASMAIVQWERERCPSIGARLFRTL